jgi:hypothetical protein
MVAKAVPCYLSREQYEVGFGVFELRCDEPLGRLFGQVSAGNG